MSEDLTDVERAMLDFTKTPWRYKGQQDEAIRERFGISPTGSGSGCWRSSTAPKPLAYDPVTVHRLQRLFSRRHSA
jgi:hypothetical protein